MAGGPAPRNGYRPDIDGLRAVAIALVVAGHVGMPGLQGGFVGVDIFFVISGYLIIGLLTREQQRTGRVAIPPFFARRARRLLPVLCTVVVATLLLGSLTLLPDAQVNLAQSGLAGLGFVANVYFWRAGQNYFADTAAVLPFQHLWTLAVEEQFYLVAPFAVTLVAAVARRLRYRASPTIAGAIAGMCVCSLLLAIVGASHFPAAAFMLAPTRAWELGFGGLLAMVPLARVPRRLASVSAVAGIAAILVAAMFFDDSTPYPSWFAMLPVTGSMLVILGSSLAPGGIVSRALAARPMVAIGKRSYGWYLWHWPLLALTRSRLGTDPAVLRDSAIAFGALGLAAISYRWLELPIKGGRFALLRTTRGALASAGVLLLASGSACVCLWAWGNRPVPQGSILAQYLAAPRGSESDFRFCGDKAAGPDCVFGRREGQPTILLWGDSHASHLTAGLGAAADRAGIRVVARTRVSCLPSLIDAQWGNHGTIVSRQQCVDFNRAVLAAIPALIRDEHVRGVVIGGNWDQRDPHLAATLAMIAHRLNTAGLNVVLVGDVPRQRFDFAACATWRDPANCAVPRSRVEADQRPVTHILDEIARMAPDVTVWSPLDALCPAGQCAAVANGHLLYRNPWHLNRAGSATLAPAMADMITWLGKAPPKGLTPR